MEIHIPDFVNEGFGSITCGFGYQLSCTLLFNYCKICSQKGLEGSAQQDFLKKEYSGTMQGRRKIGIWITEQPSVPGC